MLDKSHFGPWCSDTTLRLLLKDVKHVNRPCESDRVNGAIGIPILMIHNLQDACASKPFERFGERGFAADLRIPQGAAHAPFNRFRQDPQIVPTRSDPADRLRRLFIFHTPVHSDICLFRHDCNGSLELPDSNTMDTLIEHLSQESLTQPVSDGAWLWA